VSAKNPEPKGPRWVRRINIRQTRRMGNGIFFNDCCPSRVGNPVGRERRGRRPLPLASGAQRSALCDENWLPMATIAAEFRPMVYNLWLLQSLGSRRDLATDPTPCSNTTRAPTPKDGPRCLRRAVSIVNRLRRLTNQDPRVSTRVNRSTVGNDLAWSIL